MYPPHESIAVGTLFSLEASIPNSNSTTTLGLELHVADEWSHTGRFHQFMRWNSLSSPLKLQLLINAPKLEHVVV